MEWELGRPGREVDGRIQRIHRLHPSTRQGSGTILCPAAPYDFLTVSFRSRILIVITERKKHDPNHYD
jgi:hypothetical protein